MGILFCIFKYFPFGGLQKDFLRIACECRDRGHKIVIYTFSWEGDIPEGFDVRFVPNKRYTNHGKASFFSRWILKELRRNSYQAVVGFNRIKGLDIYFAGDNCLQEKRVFERPFFYKYTPRFLTYSAFEKAVFKTSSSVQILALTEQQKTDYIRHYSTQDERFHVLPPGISLDNKFSPSIPKLRQDTRVSLGIANDKIVLLQIGSGFKTKGVDRSIRAVGYLPKIITEKIVFLIVGQGNPNRLIRLSKNLNIKQQVVFLGGRNDIHNLLIASDLMIHPARNEATGTVLIEALVTGLPVLCTATCGYSSYINDARAGIIIPEPFNQEVLNRALSDLLANKKELINIRNNAIKYCKNQNFHARHIYATDIIEELINNKNSNRICRKKKKLHPPPHFLYLRDDFQKVWIGKDPFEEADKLDGQIFRIMKNRRTLQFELNKKKFFLKMHHAIGWQEIIKNILELKKPIIGARNEFTAIKKLNDLNIDTMTVCAFGERGSNPIKQESFLITEALENTVSLEDFCKNWKKIPPAVMVKFVLIKKLASISRKLHSNGLNHRDYYICHFLMNISFGVERIISEKDIKLYIIDLHRLQIRKRTPYRWVIKDIAGLWFSAMDIGLTLKDCFRFIKLYSQDSLRNILTRDRSFWKDVNKTAKRLYKKDHGKTPKIDWEVYD